AAAGARDTILVWNLAVDEAGASKVIRRTGEPAGPAHGLTFLPDGKTLAVVSEHNTVLFWDVATGASVRHFDGHDGYVTPVASSPRGDTLATGSTDGTVRLWNPATGKARDGKGWRNDLAPWALAFTPNGRALAVGQSHGVVRLREIA